MIIKMKKQFFDSLPIERIGHACFEPMVPVYQNNVRGRTGKDVLDYKFTFFNSLTKGQQALFIFFAYYDHAIKSEFEFYQFSKIHISSQTFSAVKKGVQYFKDDNMFRLLSQLEDILKSQNKIGIETDDHAECPESVNRLYSTFQEISPGTIRLIGACIKKNPAGFICFDES